MRRLVFPALLLLGTTHCSVDPLDLEGKSCPCGGGYVCVDNSCLRGSSQLDAMVDAPTSDSDAGPDVDVTDAPTEGDADVERVDADANPDAPVVDADADVQDVDADAGPACAAPEPPPLPRMASGRKHVCVIRSGELWCWGSNDNGQLGVGDQDNRPAPTRVGTESDWQTLSAGWTHTCGVRSNGTWDRLYCWGNNDNGQLGIGSNAPNALVPTLVSQNIEFRSVAAGMWHTCGLDTGGTLWCWGNQVGGAVGLGNLSGIMISPARVSETLSFSALAAGQGHNCAVRDDGTMWCWGYSQCFQLSALAHAIVPSLANDGCWHGVATGNNFNCAIAQQDHTLRCWGENAAGQLGMGSEGGETPPSGCEGYPDPQEVLGGHLFEFVATGLDHACGITDGGELYCWGFNSDRQVTSPNGNVLEPILAAPGNDWVEASGGFFHTCARNSLDEIYCRGTIGGTSSGEMVLVEF